MLYEIHMLKNYPSTNLNRDDTGAPKTCVFGGVTRGRISSQCLKRSWRTFPQFKELVGEFVTKPQGKPTIAPESDSRQPFSSAASDFAGVAESGS